MSKQIPGDHAVTLKFYKFQEIIASLLINCFRAEIESLAVQVFPVHNSYFLETTNATYDKLTGPWIKTGTGDEFRIIFQKENILILAEYPLYISLLARWVIGPYWIG